MWVMEPSSVCPVCSSPYNMNLFLHTANKKSLLGCSIYLHWTSCTAITYHSSVVLYEHNVRKKNFFKRVFVLHLCCNFKYVLKHSIPKIGDTTCLSLDMHKWLQVYSRKGWSQKCAALENIFKKSTFFACPFKTILVCGLFKCCLYGSYIVHFYFSDISPR